MTTEFGAEAAGEVLHERKQTLTCSRSVLYAACGS